MSRRVPRTTDRSKSLFLEALASGLTVKECCTAAGISRSGAYLLRSQEEDFAAAWTEALEDGTDELEAAARKRAVEGVARITYDRDGGVRSEERVYSDRLLELLLKARRPEVYRERMSVDQTTTVRDERRQLRAAAAADPEAFERMSRAMAEVQGPDEKEEP